MPSTLRFLRQFVRPRPDAVVLEETTYRRGDETLPASLYRPAALARSAPAGKAGGNSAKDARLPGWVALHGLTYRGRQHESLDGFARALAASGMVVLVPDLPEWRSLEMAPAAAAETIKAAVFALGDRSDILPDRVGVMGFSFGGTRSLVASTDPALEGRLSAVASWGAYAELDRVVRFMFLGDHDLDGVHHRLDPDPYGRWILAGNYLTGIPGLRDAEPLRRALHELAREVGRRKILAWTPATDPVKEELRAPLTGRDRDFFDLLAPPTTRPPTEDDGARLGELARALSRAAVAADPLLDAREALDRVSVPVFLAHGREDRLAPWTELERLRRALPAGRVRHSVVTGLFAHSFRERRFPTPTIAWEGLRFGRAIHRMVHLI